MIRAFPYSRAVFPRRGPRLQAIRSQLPRFGSLLALVLVAAVAAVLVALLAAVTIAYVALAQRPTVVNFGISDGARDLPLDSAIRVVPDGWAARVETAALWETPVESAGGSAARQVPLQLETIREGWLPGQTELVARPTEGGLRPDANYRLILRGAALSAALPWPLPAPYEREIRFATLPSPKPLALPGTTELKWQAPLPIRWSQPIDDFHYEVSPPAKSRGWVDSNDPSVSYVLIEQPDEATTYQVTVTDAHGTNGITLQRPASYTVLTPARPRVLGGETEGQVVAEIGKPLAIRWNVPIERMTYQVNPTLVGALQADPADPAVMQLQLEGLAQGASYRLTIREAVARSGAPLGEPQTLTVTTPPPLAVAEFAPEARAPITARPTMTFSEPVRDPAAVEAAMSAEPTIPGHFEWLDASQVRFVPSQSLPYDTKFTFRLRGGPDGPRSAAGGYLEDGARFSFTTVPNKTIDVNVSRQVMTLYEGGQAVRTFLVATGIPGADTPIGEFRVQYKMPTARFRGYNAAAGHAYDLDNVKWVLAFMGDYTIHGAYWRQAFGTPGSNGCVSLTDGDAAILYNWAPEGTLIKIHY